MNSSAPRKTPPRRQAAPPITAPSSDKTTCLVFLDDKEKEFLEPLRHSATRSGGQYRIHTFHTGSQTNFPAFLLDLIEKGEPPDALLIDLIIADSEEGQSGLDYLTALRAEPRLLGVPAVIATSAGDGSVAWDEDNYERTQPGLATIDGADDYLLGKQASIDFLNECRRRLPFWRVQARSRLWQTLIHRLHSPNTKGSWETVSRDITREAFDFLHKQLGVDHALLRMNDLLPGATYDIVVRLNAEWAEPQKKASSKEVLILQTILEARGKAVAVESLSDAQVKAFKDDPRGMRLLGVALCPPGEEPLGIITLLREKANKGFTKLDEFWVERLAGSLSAILGQSRHVQQLKDRQARALEFAKHLDAARDEASLCQRLAEFLHKEMHGETHPQSKVTVRLIAPGEPVLKRLGAAGAYLDGGDIPLDKDGEDYQRSVCAIVVNNCKAENIPDVTLPKWKDCYTDHYPGYPVRSELCIPIQVGMAALGAINLEHADVAYYRDHDEPFVETIAAYAAQSLRQLRHQKLAESLLEWAAEAHRLTAALLWEKAANALFAYCGYGALLHLAPPTGWPSDQGQNPWRVEWVHVPVLGTGVTKELTEWQGHVANNWQDTLVRRSLTLLQQDKTPLLTDNTNDFVQAGPLLGGARQRGNALVPLVTRDGLFIGVLVLLWFHRPALDVEDKALLATFGRYCAELAAHQADWASQENQLRLAEQRAVLANAAQQFEHVLANRLGGIGNALNSMKREIATAVPDPAQRAALMQNISVAQDRLEELDTRSRRAVLYMRVPFMQAVVAEEVWARVVTDMADKVRKTGADVTVPGSTTACRADPEILYNLLFILLDNALDAVKGRAERRVWLQPGACADSVELTVADTGPGLSPEVREKLFVEEGISSKHTLGVGLFLARQRARAMAGDLTERGDANGARFVLTLPIEEKLA